ncbi:MAG TPA: helix-turn-helix domain-containing protein [Candidatus Paceibacterota bacterium]|nr:helix-turn-helix domain-containing protein [Candidatus Paceibacterota bacterium]
MSSNSGLGSVKTIRSINSIRSRVLARRHELGLTQTELANQAGVSRKWISTFEKGSSRAELELVLRLIDTLGLDLVIVDRTPPTDVSTGKYVDTKHSVGQRKLLQIDLNEILGKQK